MDVTIKYCKPCGYRKRAEALAERLRRELKANVTLVPGNLGVFKVWAAGELIYDKRETRGLLGKLGFGVVPSDDEILSRIPSQQATQQ